MKRAVVLACALVTVIAFIQLFLLVGSGAPVDAVSDGGAEGTNDNGADAVRVRGGRKKHGGNGRPGSAGDTKVKSGAGSGGKAGARAACDSWDCEDAAQGSVGSVAAGGYSGPGNGGGSVTDGGKRKSKPGSGGGSSVVGDGDGSSSGSVGADDGSAGVAPPSDGSKGNGKGSKGGGAKGRPKAKPKPAAPAKPVYQKAKPDGAGKKSSHAAKDFFCLNRASADEEASVDSTTMTSFISTGGRFPILLVTKDRHEQLKNTLASLLAVRCVTKEDVFIVQDGENGLVSDIIAQHGIRKDVHREEGFVHDGAAKIATNYGYALGKAFESNPRAPAVIVVEDDFAFSPDFYEYFHAVAPALEADTSLWLASAWHDNGFDYLVADPYGLRRTRYFPGLGWLLPRRLWEQELAHKWPTTHWDHWMRDPAQHRGRDIIVPEIPRDYHMGIKGTFMDSGTHNRYFGSIAMQADSGFTWDTPTGASAIEDVMTPQYDARLRELVRDKDTVHIKSVADLATFTEGNGVVWYSVPPGEPNHDHMRTVAAYFGIWHEGGRASRDGVHELWWLGAARLVLVNAYSGPTPQGVPHVTGSIEVSSLRHLMPKGHRVLDWSEFLNQQRPQLPKHGNLFGAVLRSPLAHVDGGADANGAPDIGSGTDGGGGSVVVYTRVASGHEEEEEGGEEHDHSRFMGDLRLARGQAAPQAGGGALMAGQQGLSAQAKIGVLPENVHVVASSTKGLSCSDVCAAYTLAGTAAAAAAAAGGSAEAEEAEAEAGSWTCSPVYFPVINDCATLSDNLPCTKCSDSIGPDQPAMIDLSAPQDKAPGSCLVNNDPSMFSCDGRWEFARRLCPCELVAGE